VFRFDKDLKVYLHRAPVDFRLSINGLAALVQQALGLDPFAACVYVFSNRRRNRVKVPTLTVEQLHWLLEGIDIGVVQRHPNRVYEHAG